ncbi:MAG TPA: peptidoglycan-binding protein [Bryobacteraceae bacterium]|nr:peptidoglycan-binding protein [Bryobacteraceae bacterium]
MQIKTSVGFHGTNHLQDVKAIQQAVNRVPVSKGGPAQPLSEDGICGPITVLAIRSFQRFNLGFADGRVDPIGKTIQALRAWGMPVPGLEPRDSGKAVPFAAINVWPTDHTRVAVEPLRKTGVAAPPAGESLLAQLDAWLLTLRGTPTTVKGGFSGYGAEDGKWSTAAKAAKGADVQQYDLMGILALASAYNKTDIGDLVAKVRANPSLENVAKLADAIADWKLEWEEALKAVDNKADGKRIVYWGSEQPRQENELWIWQWDYGKSKLSSVMVYKWHKSKAYSASVWNWDAKYVTEAPTVALLDLQYRCLCRPQTTLETEANTSQVAVSQAPH